MSDNKLDLEAIKRRHKNLQDDIDYLEQQRDEAALFNIDRQGHRDCKDLIAEVERLTGKIRDLRLWAVEQAAKRTSHGGPATWEKFPLAYDDYGPYCPVCQAGPGRTHTEHRAGCEWMLLFQEPPK